jgi:hypothetical protein
MNAINRVMNRVLLFAAGAVLLVGGVAALAAGVLAADEPPAWLRPLAATTTDAWEAVVGWTRTWEIAGIGAVSGLWLLAAAAAVITALLLVVFVCTRKRGGSRTVLEIDTAGGRTAVDRDVADAVLTETLVGRPDVLSARTGAYRIGGVRALELAVTVRPGASLGAVVTAAEGAIREWDELLGTRVPIMLHLKDRRWRDAHRSPSRVR